jgi:hypothetical protein
MACDIDDREGSSPSPMELRLGRMFHSSAIGRRPRATLLDQSRGCQVLHEVPISSVGEMMVRAATGLIEGHSLSTPKKTARKEWSGRPGSNRRRPAWELASPIFEKTSLPSVVSEVGPLPHPLFLFPSLPMTSRQFPAAFR